MTRDNTNEYPLRALIFNEVRPVMVIVVTNLDNVIYLVSRQYILCIDRRKRQTKQDVI